MQVYHRVGCVLVLAAALLVGCGADTPAAPTPATINQPTSAASPTEAPAAPPATTPGNYPAPVDSTPGVYPPPTP
jgi:hypothetical protein